jgi:hypothetical protein
MKAVLLRVCLMVVLVMVREQQRETATARVSDQRRRGEEGYTCKAKGERDEGAAVMVRQLARIGWSRAAAGTKTGGWSRA